jgi:REP element-mobilizing transposase RayT
MNRGIAKRTLFERHDDYAFFLSRLAREVRRGEIEVHAYSVLTTHFHLLLRSPKAHLSEVMQRVEDAYARTFNRGRRRDGPLFRGRFTNRILESEAYWLSVLLYIDRNPVQAGLVTRPVDWKFGSARQYARPRGPRWLNRELVETYAAILPLEGFRPGDYERFSERTLPDAVPWLVERRLTTPVPNEEDPMADILGAAPSEVRRWMERKARLADGTSPGCAAVTPGTVSAVMAHRRRHRSGQRLRQGRGPDLDFAELLEMWLLRNGAGLKLAEIGGRMGRSVPTVHGRLRAGARAMLESGEFREKAASALEEALLLDYGGLPLGRRLPPGVLASRAV